VTLKIKVACFWKEIYNPNFNYGGFAIIKSKEGLNNYKISAKEWIEKTMANCGKI
jgi:hypothetical protein